MRTKDPDLCDDCQLMHELIEAPIGKVVPTLGLKKTDQLMRAAARWALAPDEHFDPVFRAARGLV
ncbi:MAG: hypothetical protein HYV07_21600 [Deltaproteobacteria bacterium]|nr:hypothetical protein [Deltaproteobacteria bacterium]